MKILSTVEGVMDRAAVERLAMERAAREVQRAMKDFDVPYVDTVCFCDDLLKAGSVFRKRGAQSLHDVRLFSKNSWPITCDGSILCWCDPKIYGIETSWVEQMTVFEGMWFISKLW